MTHTITSILRQLHAHSITQAQAYRALLKSYSQEMAEAIMARGE